MKVYEGKINKKILNKFLGIYPKKVRRITKDRFIIYTKFSKYLLKKYA